MTRQRTLESRILSAIALSIVPLTIVALLAPAAAAQNPVPFIDQPLVPEATAPGGAPFTLTVNGAGFVAGSTVNWNGKPRTTTFVSAHQLTAAILSSDITKASTVNVTVVSPGPGGGTSTAAPFEVALPEPRVSFSLAQYGVDFGAASVATGDLNGDGALDLVVANLYSNTVSVLLGKGNGTFNPAVEYSTPAGNFSVTVGDFNGDGKLDLAVAGGGGVSMLLGNGDGTFQPYVFYPAGSFFVATGDFNGDGKLDLVTVNNNGNGNGTVGVLLGNGDGSFQAPVYYAVGLGPYSVAVGDFSGNGKLDLAVPNYAGGTLSVLMGNGDGSFEPQVVYSTGGQPISVAAADFNGDGNLDLAVANFCCDGAIFVLLGNGDGTFQPQVSYAAPFVPYAIVVGDFNGDGKLDLAVADGTSTVSLFLGNGDGKFQPYVAYAAGVYPQSLVAGDFSGEGRLDLAVGNYNVGYSTVSVLLQPTHAGSPTSTTLSSNLNPSIYGQSVTWTATVTTTGSIPPTGSVNFKYTALGITYSLGVGQLNASGIATLTRSNLNADLYPITASYEGDANNRGSTSSVLNQVITQATTTATLISAPNPSTQGEAVTFTAAIASPTVIPTGPVTFTAGKSTLGTAQLSHGKATFTTSTLAPGSTTVTATYDGDSNIAESSASVTQVVQQ